MRNTNSQKNSLIGLAGTLACAFLAAITLVFLYAGVGEAHGHDSHMHASASPFEGHKIGGHSCPLVHHPERETCPLSHRAKIDNVVSIKSCGNSPAEGVPASSGFSKETVALEILCDLLLPLESRQVYFSASLYTPLLSDPLDHPPKSL